jgi:hypothetical protein
LMRCHTRVRCWVNTIPWLPLFSSTVFLLYLSVFTVRHITLRTACAQVRTLRVCRMQPDDAKKNGTPTSAGMTYLPSFPRRREPHFCCMATAQPSQAGASSRV